MHHGRNDQLISPLNSVNYYKSVVDIIGGAAKTTNSIRLFMAPGMNHCRNGEGPNTFDAVSALEQWAEKGKAPDQSSLPTAWPAKSIAHVSYAPTIRSRITKEAEALTTQQTLAAKHPDRGDDRHRITRQ
jgi:hypothetical protein